MTTPARWLDRTGVEDLAAELNRAAVVAADYGVRVGYHNHSQEFVASIDGISAYALIAELLHERVVLELDVF